MNNQKKLENRKKLKHGTTTVILTAVVVLAVIIINIVFTKLAYANNWYVDMTENQVYELSDQGRALLDTVDPKAKIVVHFCTPLDKLDDNGKQKMVFELVKQISAEYPNVSYDYIDTVKDISKAYKYKEGTDTVSADSIIVESGTEFRKFSLEQMFIYDPSTYLYWAFDGEKRLVTAMAAVTQAEKPIAYLSTGHGETPGYNYDQSGTAIPTPFTQLLIDAGYEVRDINLKNEEFHEDARLLVIMNPIFDFAGDPEDAAPDNRSEIDKIKEWLDDKGNLMVFRGGHDQIQTQNYDKGLPELDDLLSEWGIEFQNTYLADSANAIITGNQNTVPIIEGQYATGNTVGANLVSDYTSMSSAPKVVVPDARPIKLREPRNSRNASAVITAQSTAGVYSYTGEKLAASGEAPVVAVSRFATIKPDENEERYNYVYAIGSRGFADASYLNASYTNSDILYSMMRQMGRAQVPIDIDFKPFENEALDINIDEASTISWILVLAIPAAVMVTGLIVHIRRKRA